MVGSAERWRVLGLCLLLVSCRRIVISAVDAPEDAQLDADTGEVEDAQPADDDAQGGDAAAGDAAADADDATLELDANDADAPPLNTPIDAGEAGTIDAGARDAGLPRDAGSDGARPSRDAGPDAMLPACAGARILELCWYLGNLGASCEQTCGGKGGYDMRASSVVGTTKQGGSLNDCAQVLAAVGYTGSVIPGYRSDDLGLGCHVWEGQGWWLDSMPDMNASSSVAVANIACACLR